jgi:hypothetical protein
MPASHVIQGWETCCFSTEFGPGVLRRFQAVVFGILEQEHILQISILFLVLSTEKLKTFYIGLSVDYY